MALTGVSFLIGLRLDLPEALPPNFEEAAIAFALALDEFFFVVWVAAAVLEALAFSGLLPAVAFAALFAAAVVVLSLSASAGEVL